MSAFMAVFYFIFSLAFNLLTFILWARVALQFFRVSTVHPISHLVYALSNPFMQPLFKVLKHAPKRLKRYDWPTLLVLISVIFLKFVLINAFFFGNAMSFPIVVLYTLASLITEPCNLLFYAIIGRVLISWINPRWQHPLATLLMFVTEPILAKIRRYLPPVASLDFAPLLGIVLLKIPTIFIGHLLPLNLL